MNKGEARIVSAFLRGVACPCDARLRDKCQWEQMTRLAVLMDWGHPRNYPDMNCPIHPPEADADKDDE